MAQITVTIAGRSYRMACGDGEEAHLQSLAALVDHRIESLKREFGEIGDQRITMMAALTFADELGESKRRRTSLEADAQAAEEQRGATADALTDAARRIERLAQMLGQEDRG